MDELTKADIIRVIQEILKDGYIIFPPHAKEQMSGRGYSFADIKHILKNGMLTEIAFHKKECRYTFCGKDLDDHAGVLVIELRKDQGKIIVITAKGGV